MPEDRFFTDEELRDLIHQEIDTVKECLNGDERGLQALQDLEKFRLAVTYTYMDFTGMALAYIQEKLGTEGFEDVCRRFGQHYMKDWYLQNRNGDWMKSWKEGPNKETFKTMIREFASLMRQQSGKGFKSVEEDDEKVIFTVDPCRSGGRFRRQGMYRPPLNWPVIKEPCALTFGLPDFPYYCGHCAIIHSQIPIELDGAMWPVMLPPQKDEDPCVYLFYKDPADCPEEYYTRVGKNKIVFEKEDMKC
jgi:hypothetical protein